MMRQKNKFVLHNLNRSRFWGSRASKAAAAFLALVALGAVLNLQTVKISVSDMLLPFFQTGAAFHGEGGSISKFFTERSRLVAENAELNERLNQSRIKELDFASLKSENERLRRELGLRPVGQSVAASILARSPQVPLDTLVLDRGGDDGLKEGDLVLASDSIAIGKIVFASNNQATAALNSIAGAVSYGYLERTGDKLEIKGSGGGSMETKVPIDFDIVVGDRVFYYGSVNRLAAIVSALEEDQSSGFKKALMSLPVDMPKVYTIFISPADYE